MRVSRYMRGHVVCLDAHAPLRHAVDAFDVYQQPVLPVVGEDGGYIGAVTCGGLLRRLEADIDTQAQNLLRADVPAVSVGEMIDASVPTALENDDIVEAGTRLRLSGAPALVVVGEAGVIGIVGLPELCRAMSESIEASA